MKKHYAREMRPIVANYSLRKIATGYNVGSRSKISDTVRDLIKLNWIDCKYINGRFLFVSPSHGLKTFLGSGETENIKPLN